MYWYICKNMHVLPNDPSFRDLSVFQMLWIWQNMTKDLDDAASAKDSVGSMTVLQSDPDLIKKKMQEYKNNIVNKGTK